jgi:hypothetical protein
VDATGGYGRRGLQLAHHGARQALLHGLEQLLQGDGFFQEGQRTDLGGFDGGVDGGVAAHHDDGHGQRAGGGPLLEQGHAIGVGHPDVEQHQVRAVAQSGGTGLGGVLCHFDVVPFVVQDLLQQIPDAQLVVNHQYVCHDFYAVPSPCGANRR